MITNFTESSSIQGQKPDFRGLETQTNPVWTAVARDVLLIVDDEAGNRDLLEVILRREDCAVLFAGDGESAIRLATTEQPSLILLDVMMPSKDGSPTKDGYDVCAQLKNDPCTAHIPIIFLTALHQSAEMIRGLSLGASDYIVKPFDRGEVVARVRSQLAVSRLTRELRAVNHRLVEKQASLDSDLRAAGYIQRALMPAPNLERVPWVQMASRLKQSDEVGGDVCNYHYIDEEHLAAYIVDVSGHGVPAAMLAVAISQSLAPPSLHRTIDGSPGIDPAMFSPAEVLRRLDREYPLERFDKFFTICYLVLDQRSGEFRYSRAGHPMPVVVRKSGALEMLETGGTIIGIGSPMPFEEGTGRLGPGDLIVMYTDGVTECQDMKGALFGDERLFRVLIGTAGAEPEAACETMMKDLLEFSGGRPMRDDVTMMAIRYEGRGAAQSAGVSRAGVWE
jgi:sigma-B regulation protein RsbU (phosphoserine phosphatase)